MKTLIEKIRSEYPASRTAYFRGLEKAAQIAENHTCLWKPGNSFGDYYTRACDGEEVGSVPQFAGHEKYCGNCGGLIMNAGFHIEETE